MKKKKNIQKNTKNKKNKANIFETADWILTPSVKPMRSVIA